MNSLPAPRPRVKVSSGYVPTTKRARVVRVLGWDAFLGRGLVRVHEAGKECDADFYHLTEIPTEIGGRAFKVEKHGEEESSYDVLVNGAESLCDCKGHGRYGHCRHVESLTAVINAGKLS